MMVDKTILWLFLILGIVFFIVSLRMQPIKNWLLSFFIAAFFSGMIGVIVESMHLIEYPITFYKKAFPSSPLFEVLVFPVINVYFYQSTYRSSILGIIAQGFLYTSVLTIGETIIRKYTNLIVYTNWNWYITLVTVFCFLLAIRFLLKWINFKNNN